MARGRISRMPDPDSSPRPRSFCRLRLAPAPRRLGPHPLDLGPRQGDADFADPFELDAVDRLGVEAREVDLAWGFAALDRLQIALAGLEPHHGLFAKETGKRVALLAIDHDHVAIFIFR